MMKNPTAVDIDAHNRIYVADFINHRINIYRLVNTTADDSFRLPEEVPEDERRFKKTES
jgi:hypothetical protein